MYIHVYICICIYIYICIYCICSTSAHPLSFLAFNATLRHHLQVVCHHALPCYMTWVKPANHFVERKSNSANQKMKM